jgi:methionyl-tRNA formyltransferase
MAGRLGCRLLPAERVRNPTFGWWMRAELVDLLINVHPLYMIHDDVVAAPRIGSFNLHPGPLPGYSGLNAPSWAILQRRAPPCRYLALDGGRNDAGGDRLRGLVDLDPTATDLSASMQCVRFGLPLIEGLVTTALTDPRAIPARPQNRAQRRYYQRRVTPFAGKLKWNLPAAELDAFIRVADYQPMPSPWGHPTTFLDGLPLGVLEVRRTGRACDAAPGTLAIGEANAIEVATADEWLVLQPIHHGGHPSRRGSSGGRAVRIAQFLPHRLAADHGHRYTDSRFPAVLPTRLEFPLWC